MTSLQDLDKKALKHYILGELAASILPAAAASAERRYRYHILGVSVCAKVFKDVHGVGEHTLKRLKELVARGTAAVPQHGNVNFMPHNALYCENQAWDRVTLFVDHLSLTETAYAFVAGSNRSII